ncbi:TIGR01212 family radical SAM protein [Shewanella zhangzhouensis]|uniref:TIGR01212 family radical SAM protein n=1 Tax=Shewanella zhangzhouensis TaxID=2864213 RepID=UPI001C65AEAB|nr:TIGR01212 family radical SAM protein [Shewanella zhangzhouensis]QYK06139.1 TIGR01212 family radical SAM protein [Shewanella zhangzhouensis]
MEAPVSQSVSVTPTLDALVNTFGNDCRLRFGTRVRKLTLDAHFTCPNRDGSLGIGGCTFCHVPSFNADDGKQFDIASQLKRQMAGQTDALYFIYFQAYTSTYDEVAVLKRRYDEALSIGNVAGLFVGTRPDCVPDAVLQLLADYQQQGIDVWLDLGLQTARDDTLKRINRGHDFAVYADAVTRARRLGIKVCTHLILGLPGETSEDFIESHRQVLALGVDGLKLHPLHIVEGSIMARQWRAGRLDTLSLDDYVNAAVQLIQRTPADIIFHRVTAHARAPLLLAPDWCGHKWLGMGAICSTLAQTGGQGCLTEYPYLSDKKT